MKLSPDQYEVLLEHIPDMGLVMFNKKLDILRIVDRYHSLREILPGIDKEKNLGELQEHDLHGDILEMCRRALEGEHEQRQIMGTSGQTKVHTLSLTIHEHEKIGVLMIQGNRGLMNDYRDELERGRVEAEETSEIKSRFMARISHEIRTPLNAIIGFIEQLHKTELDKKQEDYLKIIDKSSVYLLDLVNEILTFSKIESGEQQLEVVDFTLESLFKEIINTFKNRAQEKKINLRYSFDPELKLIFRGDAVRIKQVVINLVSNAIKFTEYGYVEVIVKHIAADDKRVWIRITVTDTGIGISAGKIQDIFKEYKQASSGIARKHGGTGLGLTISKRLTELMDGELSVKSTEGRGSEFRVDLPLEKSELAYLNKDTLKINPEVLSGRTALIVDDDAMNRMLGEVILEGFSMKVSLASDGTEAIGLLQQSRFDLILLDIHMPVISGLEVAEFVRKELNDQKVKIIAVTADMVKEELDHFLEHGIDAYLIKPYREINMFNKICQTMDISSSTLQQEAVKIVLKEDVGLKSYDLDELRSVTRGNDAFFKEMIETFIQNAEKGLQQFRQEYERENWKGIRETAHRLIPSFKHLSIKSGVSNLIELKNRCRKKPDMIHLATLISKIEKETEEVITQLKQEINKTT
jgi:signal transduction histidine kinase/response regulator RpfG family c-di-GMP phosphodiesterase